MTILIDINHPAHVHYFKNFYKLMTDEGHEIIIVARRKEIAQQLLDIYKIPYIDRGRGKESAIGKFVYLVYADSKLYRIARKFKPDIFLNFLHPYPSHIAFLMRKPSLVFSDTESAKLHHKLTVPFATKVFTPSCYTIDIGKKQVRFNSYMELSYLHPNYFVPDDSILDTLNVKKGEKYVILRFVSWKAAHDFGHKGMSLENKRKTVEVLSKYAKVFITSESELPEDLEKYRISISPERMHDAIYFSSLLFGESATMASEAAVLGTPSIFMDNEGRGYNTEQEKVYGLSFNFTESDQDQIHAINKAEEIIQTDGSIFEEKRQKLLKDKDDLTQYMIKVVKEAI